MSHSTVRALLTAGSCWLALALPSRIEASSCRVNSEPDTSDIANTSYVSLMKSTTLPSGTTYRYVFSPPFEPEKPYLLFLHGFPDSSYGWHPQIDYFTQQGYGVIAPDLLGYGGTDNPTDLQSFSLKNMAIEVGQLLDCEGVDQVIGVAHDLGTALLSRVHTYQQKRLLALAFLDIGYFAPVQDLTEQAISSLNNATAATLGYTIYGYWYFQNSAQAASIVDSHLDSMYTLFYTHNATYWKEDFAPVGALERWLLEDKMAPIGGEYVSRVTLEQWKSIMRAQGGLDGPLKWYKSHMRGTNTPDVEEIRSMSGAIEQPVLLILADRDPVGLPNVQLNGTVPYAANLQVRSIDSGHFVQIEAARETNLHLESFFQVVLNGTLP